MRVPHLRRKIVTLCAVMLLMLSAGFVAGMRRERSEKPRVEYFDVEKGTFVAETHNIKRMEVWAVPESASGESDWQVLGTMKRMSHWWSWAFWELSIPPEPGPTKQILVRAYDETGTEADRVSLPWIGAKILHEELWEKSEQ